MNEIATERNLNDRSVAFRDIDISRRVISAESVDADSVHSTNFIWRWDELRICPAPKNHRSDDVTRARRVIIKETENTVFPEF
jgi:hypothetical protein